MMFKALRGMSTIWRIFWPTSVQLEMEEENANDHLSRLPDDIIRLILSWMPLRDAIRTGILSRRWRNLWMTLRNLSFLGRDIVRGYHPHKSGLNFAYEKKFIKFVDNFLGHHVGIGVEAFVISYAFYADRTEQLDRWISFAIKSGAKDIKLLLSHGSVSSYSPSYKFPSQLFSRGTTSSLVRLCLRHCVMCTLPDLDGFRSLKELSMDGVMLSNDVLCSIVSECSLLEKLCLKFCQQIADLKIYSTSSQLKYLSIDSCVQLKRIELFQLNLVDFDYSGKWASIVLHGLPQLVRVAIAFEPQIEPYTTSLLVRLSSAAPQLKSLQWTSFANPIHEQYVGLARGRNFANVRHLGLCVWHSSSARDLEWVVFLLGTMPHLEKLVLHFIFLPRWTQLAGGKSIELPKLPKLLRHRYLREVELHGFKFFVNHRVLMTSILKIAISLKVIKFCRKCKCYDPYTDQLCDSVGQTADCLFESGVKYFYQTIRIPPGVKLVVIR